MSCTLGKCMVLYCKWSKVQWYAKSPFQTTFRWSYNKGGLKLNGLYKPSITFHSTLNCIFKVLYM